MRGGRNYPGNYTNPCLTMHQPWASLLVYGIKRIEGRSWPSPIRGRLWIHAASKVPEDDTIKAMEDFYREIYAVNGITALKFPEHYPVSRLVGCIDVVGCVRREELANWEVVPEGVRLEGQTDFCWLCEQPKKLIIPFEMRGNQGVYNLEKRIYEAAVRGIIPVEGPLPVKFPLPNPRDLFSLKPGSISVQFPVSKTSQVEKSPGLSAAIAGARAAATQYSKKDHNSLANASYNRNIPDSRRIDQSKEKPMEDTKLPFGGLGERNNEGSLLSHENDQKSQFEHQQNIGNRNQLIPTDLDQHTAASSKHKSLEATKFRFGSLGERNNEVSSLSHEDEQKSHFEHHRNSGSCSQLLPTISNQHSAVSSKHKSMEATKLPSGSLDERNNEGSSLSHENEQISHFEHHRNSGSRSQSIPTTSNQHSAASPKLFATALRGLRLS